MPGTTTTPQPPAPPEPPSGALLWAGSTSIGLVALLIAVVALFTPGTKGGGTAVASAATASTATKTVAVELGDLYVKPATLTVAPGQKVKFEVVNSASATLDHDFKVNGTVGTRMLKPGATQTFTAGPFDASTEAWCTVAGHKAAGMVMKIVVGTGTPAPNAHDMPMIAQASATPVSASAVDTNAVIDFNKAPAPEWKPFDPALKPAPGATVHDITLNATETVLEVAPGTKQEMWTFGGQVPGPILRGHVGDVFNITLVNKGKVGHSIDFHASRVAWNDEMRTIAPGESLVYQFKAEYAGIYMYHCGTAPALHHIGNGMYGAIVIDPPNLPAVDHEYVLIQSELYTGPDGQAGDFTKMTNEAWDAVVFNGYVSQYKFSPIRVEPNQRIRVWVLDAGPSENSAFHIVGTVFDRVFKEGSYLLQPGATQGGSQVLDLQPAQGGFVEFSFAEKGLYPIVTHKFANPGKGALGLFQAGDVQMPAGAGH